MSKKRFVLLLLFAGLLVMITGCSGDAQQAFVETPSSVPVSSQPTQPTIPVTPPTVPPADPIIVCIDAGHQQSAIWETEPNGPGSDVMKTKLSSGTQGVATKIPEYQLNLEVSLLLEAELIARGYQVVMIRRTNDCPFSNAQRAMIANESGADIFIRIHANSAEDPTVSGVLCCAPPKDNPFLTEQVVTESIRLSEMMTQQFCEATGAQNRGLYYVDTMTGINWCQIPVTIVEMGFMSNPEEDQLMATAEYRTKMVAGMADGIDAYFEKM